MWNPLRPGIARAAVVAALLLSAACSNSSPDPAASGTIGPAGGTIEVTTGSLIGTSIRVPAGALAVDTVIGIYTGSAISTRGTDVVGPATMFSPTEQQLAAAAEFSILFDPTRVSAGTVASDILVAAQSRTGGEITTITPTSVDLQAGRANFTATVLASFWAKAPTVYRTESYFVLGDGNRYEFDGGIALDVSVSTTEPGLEGRSIWRLVFTSAFFARTGLYLEEDPGDGSLDFVGQFDAPLGLPAVQELTDAPFPLLMATERIGDTRTTPYDYTAYQINQPNPPAQIYTGSGEVTVTVVAEGSVSVPAGAFDPVLLIEFESEFTDSRPASGAGFTSLWLAPDVGPVMIQRGEEQPQGLVQALVNGNVIQ